MGENKNGICWGKTLFIMDYTVSVLIVPDSRVDSSQLVETIRSIADELGYDESLKSDPLYLARHIRGRCLYELGE